MLPGRRGVDGDFDATLALFWHPVCTEAELRGARTEGRGPLAVRLLGRELVVADLPGPGLVALDDRCAHAPARLSSGTLSDVAARARDVARSAYYGWCFRGEGPCGHTLGSYAAASAYGLVWVRLDNVAGEAIGLPPGPEFDDSQPRAEPALARVPATTLTAEAAGTLGGCRLVMPTTVIAESESSAVWMTVSPVDAGTSRTFSLTSGSNGSRHHDAGHHSPGRRVSSSSVAAAYERRLRDLAEARAVGPDAVVAALHRPFAPSTPSMGVQGANGGRAVDANGRLHADWPILTLASH